MDFIHITRDGIILDFSKPKLPEEYTIDQCLDTLYQEKRFSNQSDLSVLEHLVAVGRVLKNNYEDKENLILYGYTHDLQEAVIRDVPSPFKKLVGPTFTIVEKEIESKMFKHFGIYKQTILNKKDFEVFKFIDSFAAEVEMDVFLGVNSWDLFGKGIKNPVFDAYENLQDMPLYQEFADQFSIILDTPPNVLIQEIKDFIFSCKKVVV